MLLVNKYQPGILQEVIGQDFAIKRLKEAIVKNKSCLIYGGVGNGKTTSVYALAGELGYEVFELNASDSRSRDNVNNALNRAVKQMSLFNKNKIILVDDVDALSGHDRGGLQAILDFLKESEFSFVFTAYNINDDRFKVLKNICEVIEFNLVDSVAVFGLLQEICRKEGVYVNDKLLREIAGKCNGDVRNAINELESLLVMQESNEFSYKDSRLSIVDFLNIIFKSKNHDAILKTIDGVDESFDEIMLWIDENLPYEYNSGDLAKAYDALSKADVFKGRIRSRQYFRLLVYQKEFMSLGVALAKEEKKNISVRYRRTSRLLKIWMMNRKNAEKKAIAEKLAARIHMSRKKAFKEMEFMRFVGAGDFSFVNNKN